MGLEERIEVRPCGCRCDWVTGLVTAYCPAHDARRLVEEARRVCQAWAERNEDAAYVDAILGRALEAMGR